jgi:predicted NAD/FAD-binding protein
VRVAVVGAGIAGLTAAYYLCREHEVVVFEKEPRLGGHAHTHSTEAAGATLRLDSGFVVYNHRTYPNFVRLLDELGVPGQPSDMSFGVNCRACGLEYSSRGLGGLFAQPRRALDPMHWRTLADIPRFNRRARAFLQGGASDSATLGDFLDAGAYSRGFVRHFLLPMGGAIWSAPAGAMRRFPAASFLRFFDNHGWLTLHGAHRWWTVQGGSRAYVEAIRRPFATGVRAGQAVSSVRRYARGVSVVAGGVAERFDKLVLATHADVSLRLLDDPSGEERQLLSCFRYSTNRAILHTDAAVLPRARGAWASWNCHVSDCRDEEAPVSISYDLNRLQGLPGSTQYCVSLNHEGVSEDAVIARMDYEHPLLDAAAVAAQPRLEALGGTRHTYFCGAHLRNGFHEDGVVSALRVAAQLGLAVKAA